jgi:hypothetical protein
MPEEKDPRELNIRQLMPWTELFRAFQIALEPYKLLLAAVAIIVLTFGWWLLALIFGVDNQFGEWPPNAPRGTNPYTVVTERRGDLISAEFWVGNIGRRGTKTLPPEATAPAPEPPAAPGVAGKEPTEKAKSPPSAAADPKRSTDSADDSQASLVLEIYNQPPVHLEPFHKFIGPVTGLLKHNPGKREWWYCLFGLIMTLAIWAIFGGAITRIAAVQIARNEKISIMEALRFSISKFLSFFAAPLIPFGGVALLALLLMIAGFLYLIPWIGEFVVALLWIFALAGGLIMGLILIGLVGWPLMYATVSTEGSDSFDALSRCYAYVFQRPWHYLFYSVVAMLYGILVIFFIVFITSFLVYLAKWAVSLTPGIHWRATTDPVSASFYYAPTSYNWQQLLMKDHPYIAQINLKALDSQLEGAVTPAERRARIEAFLGERGASQADVTRVLRSSGPDREAVLFEIGRARVYKDMNNAQLVGAGIIAFWLHLLFLLMLGFAYSYFWSVSTIIYFLLRKRVDDTDMDEVYLEEEEEEAYPTPTSSNSGGRPGASTLPMVDPPKPPEPSRPAAPSPEHAKAPPTPPEPPKAAPEPKVDKPASDPGTKPDGNSTAK